MVEDIDNEHCELSKKIQRPISSASFPSVVLNGPKVWRSIKEIVTSVKQSFLFRFFLCK